MTQLSLIALVMGRGLALIVARVRVKMVRVILQSVRLCLSRRFKLSNRDELHILEVHSREDSFDQLDLLIRKLK